MSNRDDELEYYDDDETDDEELDDINLDDELEEDDEDESLGASRLGRPQVKPFSPSGTGSGTSSAGRPSGGVSRGTSSLPGRGDASQRYGASRYTPGGSSPRDDSPGGARSPFGGSAPRDRGDTSSPGGARSPLGSPPAAPRDRDAAPGGDRPRPAFSSGSSPDRPGGARPAYSGGSGVSREDSSGGTRSPFSSPGSRNQEETSGATRSPFGSPASQDRGAAPGGDRSRPAFSSGSPSDRPGSTRPAFSGGGSSPREDSPGGSRSPFGSPSARDREEPAGGSRSPFGGSAAHDRDKPSDQGKPAGDGGLRSPFSRGGAPSGGDRGNKKDDKSKRDSDGSGNPLSRGLGGLRGKLPGGKAGDKKENRPVPARRDSEGGSAPGRGLGALGGFRNKLPGGGDRGGDKKEDRAARPTGGDRGGSAPSRGLGGFRNRLPGGGDKDRPDTKPDIAERPTAAAAAGRPGDARFGSRGAAPSSTASAADRQGKSSGGGFASRLPFLNRSKDDRPRPATTREKLERASKAPRIDETGLTLDNKLDILGVVLVLAALALFFSSMSATKGQLTEAINTFLSQLLGLGAIAVPIVMFAIGGWLIVRHFGDDAPIVDPVRIAGIVLLYISALLAFQFFETFNPAYATINLADPNQLRLQLELSYMRGLGGGYLGAQLYYTLVTNLGEPGMMVIVLGLALIGSMLLLRLTAAEVAIFFISLWRSFTDAQRRRAQTREARARIAAAELAAAAQSQVNVSRPPTAELPEGRSPALPAAIEGEAPALEVPRPIPITMGGKTVTAFVGNDGKAEVPEAAVVDTGREQGPSVAARLFGAVPGIGRSPEPEKVEARPLPTEKPAARLGGVLGGLLNRGTDGDKTPEPEKERSTPAAVAPSPLTTPAAPPRQTPLPLGETRPAAATSKTVAPSPAATAVQTPAARPESPARIGDLLRPSGGVPARPVAERLTPAFTPPAKPDTVADTDDDAKPESNAEALETMPPATVRGTGPLPRAQNPWARPVARSSGGATTPGSTESLEERRERLNAIRSGQTTPLTAKPVQSGSVEPTPEKPAAYVPPQRPASPPGVAVTFNGDSRPEPAAPAAPVSDHNGQSALDRQPAIVARRQAGTTMAVPRRRRDWKLPEYKTLLAAGSETDFDRELLLKRARTIEETLQSFGAPGRVVEVNTGPVITQFGVEPDYLTARSGKKSRVKVGAIAQLDKDLQLALGAKSIRIEAPVPGKGYVGVEVPNEEAALVSLRDVMESDEFQKLNKKSRLVIGLGQSVDGAPISADLAAMPHLLIAGTTGSGKSVLVNAIITSLLINNRPDVVKMIMVDPKRVELTGYNGIPHLVAPVVVDLERTVGVLKWVTREMDERYKKFSDASARNIEDFNKHIPDDQEPMPYIVVIIDELADLMMLAPDETERVITRIAALARATGIHLVIATQRPSVDVVTGLIKANFPARIAFAVAGGVDSRVILDQPGAERLLGRGDMLYLSGTSPAPLRLQGVFVSPAEIDNVVRYWKRQNADQPEPQPLRAIALDEKVEQAREVQPQTANPFAQQAFWDSDADDEDEIELHERVTDERDELYDQAVEMVRRLNKASVSLLQRRLRIGYTRAARLIDMMEAEGIVGPPTEGSKPREVLPFPGQP